MKKRSILPFVCTLMLLSVLSAHAADAGPPSDIGAMILERILSALETVMAVLPEFLRGFFQAIIDFLRTLFGG